MRIKTFVTLLLALILSLNLYADYLIVSRNANIKEKPKSDGFAKHKAVKGDYLILLDSEQKNGYYYVKVPEKNIEGWVYRTLVRRYDGNIPSGIYSEYIPNPHEDLVIDVLDVGQALCNIISLPNGGYIIYDAGHWQSSGTRTLNQIKEVIPLGAPIELMILSHTDGDHIGAASNIIENYRVKKVVHTGFEKSLMSSSNKSATYERFETAMVNATYPIEVVNLYEKDSIIHTGFLRQFGEVELTYLCGFGKPLPEWNLSSKSEKLNSVSIVVKITYKGKSVLFCGDAVGRHIGDPPNSLIATEKYLVNNAGILLDSDIIIAPHHGADNGNTEEFISKATPTHVIFSAGNKHDHPTKSAAERYLKSVSLDNIFRTDLGDDEREPDKPCYEWDYGRIIGCKDPFGDDNVQIIISKEGTYTVRYITENIGCVE